MILAVSSPPTERHVGAISKVLVPIIAGGYFKNIALPIPKEVLPMVIRLAISLGRGSVVEFLRGSLGNAWLVTHEPLIDLILTLYRNYPWVNVYSSGPSINEQRMLSRIAVEMVTLTARTALVGVDSTLDRWISLHRRSMEVLDKPRVYQQDSIIVTVGYTSFLKVRNIAEDIVAVGELKPTPTELFYIYRGDYGDEFKSIVKWVVKYLEDIVPSSKSLTEAYLLITHDNDYLRLMSRIMNY